MSHLIFFTFLSHAYFFSFLSYSLLFLFSFLILWSLVFLYCFFLIIILVFVAVGLLFSAWLAWSCSALSAPVYEVVEVEPHSHPAHALSPPMNRRTAIETQLQQLGPHNSQVHS